MKTLLLAVLTASSVVYEDYWGMKNECATCPPGYRLMSDGNTCEAIMTENTDLCFNICAGATVSLYGIQGGIKSNEVAGAPVTSGTDDFYGGKLSSLVLKGKQCNRQQV